MATAKKPAKKTTQTSKKSRTIQTKKKFDAKVLAVILLVAAIGGYFLYTSHAAYPREWIPGGTASANGALYQSGGSFKSKSDGTKWWESGVASGWIELRFDHIASHKQFCADFEPFNIPAGSPSTNFINTSWSGAGIASGPTYNAAKRTVCIQSIDTAIAPTSKVTMRLTSTAFQLKVTRFYQR